MIYALLGGIILLHLYSIYKYHKIPAPLILDAPIPPAAPTHEATLEAIHKAFLDVGLNEDTFTLDLPLIHTGKLGEVLYYTSLELGKPIKTIQDLHDLLVK